MYTQCPDCSTVFRVTAEALRAAQGRVRCGICSSGFNALENLSEAPIAQARDGSVDEDTITVEELPGNEFIELSATGEADAEAAGETEGQDGPAPTHLLHWDEAAEQGAAEAPATTGDEPHAAAAQQGAPGLAEDAALPDEDTGNDRLEQEAPPEQARASDEPGEEAAPDVESDHDRYGEAEPSGSSREVGAPTEPERVEPAQEATPVEPESAMEELAEEEFDEETPAGVATTVAGPAQPQETDRADPDTLDGIPDTALEFHGSAEDLERLFIPAGAQAQDQEPSPHDIPHAIEEIAGQDLSGIEVHEDEFSWPDGDGEPFDPGNPAHVAAVLASSSGSRESGRSDDLDRTDEYPILVIEDVEVTQLPDAGPAEQAGPGEEQDAAGGAAPEAPEAPAEAEAEEAEAPAEEQDAGLTPADTPDETPLLIIPEELRRGPSATAADDLEAPLDLEEETPRRWPVAAAAVILALVLGAQAVHHWRFDLARDPFAGPWVLRAYGLLGIDLPRPVDLGAFELRQLGAASDPGQAGRIRVRASIVNHAAFAQPYPLLRLTLQDRFGSTIGARNLTPAEYLPGAEVDASGLLGASQRADAEVVFVDPGREAVGFELDICVDGDAGLRCSADLPRGAS